MTDDRRHHLRLLGALDALLSERNVTRAAARLHLSQSATSGILAQLREVFSDPLLVRVGRDLVLTARAQHMLPLVRDALLGVDTLFGTQKAFAPAALTRQFRLAVTDAVGQLLLPDLVRSLTQSAPGVTLKISAAGPEAPNKLLASGALDIAIGHFEDVPTDLRASTLYEHHLVAAVRAAHPTIRGRLTLHQLLMTPQVAIFPHSPALESALRELFIGHRQAFKLAASVQQLPVALAIVEKTDALALVTEPMARLYQKSLAIQVLPLPRSLRLPGVRVQAIWHERTHHDGACAWLRDVLRDVLRDELHQVIHPVSHPGSRGGSRPPRPQRD
jgi:DNA-binding transcriptional LysR family regulator